MSLIVSGFLTYTLAFCMCVGGEGGGGGAGQRERDGKPMLSIHLRCRLNPQPRLIRLIPVFVRCKIQLVLSRCRSNAILYEPRYEKTGFFAYAKTKTQTSFAVTAKLISAFVVATRIVQSLYFLNPKFQASSHLLCLCSPVCVRPGRKPRRPVFSQRGSFRNS